MSGGPREGAALTGVEGREISVCAETGTASATVGRVAKGKAHGASGATGSGEWRGVVLSVQHERFANSTPPEDFSRIAQQDFGDS